MNIVILNNDNDVLNSDSIFSKIGPVLPINTDDYYLLATSSVTSLADGGFLLNQVSYQGNSYNIYRQRYDANGRPIGIKYSIITDPEAISRYSITSLVNGEFVIIWQSVPFGLFAISSYYGQRFDANNNPIGSSFLIYNDGVDRSSVTLLDNRFVIVWGTDWGISNNYLANNIVGQRYDANLNPIQFKISNQYLYR